MEIDHNGAINSEKDLKHSISKVNDLKSMQYYSLDSLDHNYQKTVEHVCVFL